MICQIFRVIHKLSRAFLSSQVFLSSRAKRGICLLSLIFLSFFPFIAHAYDVENYDPKNTYQWNRTAVAENQPWYEWWYYKVNDPDTGTPFFFIYGIVNPWDLEQKEKSSRAFIGYGNFSDSLLLQDFHSPRDFEASYMATQVIIGNNRATDKRIIGAIKNEANDISWDIQINRVRSWNAMGWGMDLANFFNIYWYPAQMDAVFNGIIQQNGKIYHLKNAKGYQDRNWGVKFPKWWFWITANAFKNHPGTSLAAGGGGAARASGSPLPTAMLVGFYHGGKMYEFRNIDAGTFVDYDMELGRWRVDAQNLSHRLLIEATCERDEVLDLVFTTPDGKSFHDFEALSGEITIKLFKRKFLGWKKIVQMSERDIAGLEYGIPEEKIGERIRPQE